MKETINTILKSKGIVNYESDIDELISPIQVIKDVQKKIEPSMLNTSSIILTNNQKRSE